MILFTRLVKVNINSLKMRLVRQMHSKLVEQKAMLIGLKVENVNTVLIIQNG